MGREDGGELSLFAGLVASDREAGDERRPQLVDHDQSAEPTAHRPDGARMTRIVRLEEARPGTPSRRIRSPRTPAARSGGSPARPAECHRAISARRRTACPSTALPTPCSAASTSCACVTVPAPPPRVSCRPRPGAPDGRRRARRRSRCRVRNPPRIAASASGGVAQRPRMPPDHGLAAPDQPAEHPPVGEQAGSVG